MSAKCLSGYEWLFNSTNPSQSPCDVAAQLAGICVGSQFTLAPLVSGVVYLGPSIESADSCRCSSVYYALLSACAYCQMRSFIRWSAYNVNCSTTYVQRFVEPIPRGVNVPLWAYQDILIDDIFNVTLAKANATDTTTRPSSTSGSGSGSSINVAAIAGGVIGGFIVIGLIVGFFSFWLIRRSRRSSRKNNNNSQRIVANQTQDVPPTTNVAPYTAPGFSSSVSPNSMPMSVSATRISKPQAPHPLSQLNYMDNTPLAPRIPPAQLPSQYVPFLDTTRPSDVQSPSDYMMSRITPYTVPSPTSPNVPYTVSSSQDSKQPLLTGQSSNFSDMRTSAPVFPTGSSSGSMSYQPTHHQFPPQQGTSTMTPLTSSEQLPSYNDIMAGTISSRVPVMEKERLLTPDQQ